MSNKIETFKGFDQELRCRGFQYEIGQDYDHEGDVRACNAGFHGCERPLDVLAYYPPATSRYCKTEQSGVLSRDTEDSKVASSHIKIGAEIGIAGLVKAQIEYVKSHTTMEHTDPKMATAGNYGAATAGYSGAATAGNYGAATAGYRGAATAGYRGAATAGDRGAATAGDSGAATAGYSGAATAGNYGAATAGDRGAATAGYSGAATSRGCSAVGNEGLAVARGNGVKVKGGMGALLVLCEENDHDYGIKDWLCVVVDGVNVKPDTWYRIENGELQEVQE